MKKFLIALVLILTLCLSAFTLTACGSDKDGGSDKDFVSEGLEYSLINDGTEYEVVGIGDCRGRNIAIPSSYQNKPVTSIGDGAFEDCTSLTEIIIPDSITNIGYDAFESCTSLKSVVIPNSVKSICGEAFQRCKSLKSITIPDSVTSIGSAVFYDCTSLKTIYCEADSQPSIGWESDWKDGCNAQVVWGYKGQ